jgi:transcriptional regulator with GAF, ATPase, and Fis domain
MKKGKLEMASGGTLFLDEIGELAAPLQAKLLRVLQEREFERIGATRTVHVDLRLVAATNRDLAQESRDGKFRVDLYHRLNVVTLRTPPLRERKEDIAALAQHFLRYFGEQCKRPGLRLSPEALRCLEAYDWPGNVRELENAVEHAVVLGDGDTVFPSDLPESVWETAPPGQLGAFQSSVSDAKRESIVRAYQQAGGDYKAAAKLLGLHPNYLLRLVRNLGLREALKK